MLKIYGSFTICPLWFATFFVLQALVPGKFQDQTIVGKFSIIMLVVTGIAYVVFLIDFLSRKENADYMNCYSKKKSSKKKQGVRK